MFNKKQIMKLATVAISSLRDTKYATNDINERLTLAKMEVLKFRTALIDAEFPSDADEYAAKLKNAQEEYLRILRLSHKSKVG